MDVRAFLLEPTKRSRRYLRRFVHSRNSGGHYHDAWTLIGEVMDKRNLVIRDGKGDFDGDPRWPTKCDKCDYVFREHDQWQIFYDRIYVRKDTGEKMTLREAPPGAMWDATWMSSRDSARWHGPDGKFLIAVCPGGHHWHIDGKASNCTKPSDEVHKCWIRHGEPPNLTVDKNGDTCAAGAGSIQTPNWHGFLRNGVFTTG
jgi:hypothetical protein